MGDHTAISWAHHTMNPWVGCMKVSDGCKHCYAEEMVTRLMKKPHLWGPAATHRRERTSVANWQRAVRWNAEAERRGVARRVFAASLADVFEDHPDCNAARPDFWDLVRRTPYLQWQILTKRPEHIREMLPNDWGTHGWANVWLGTSIESMDVASRADHLCEVPAVVRFVSYEPALGPLDDLDLGGIDWVICGGESGPKYRAMSLDWAHTMRRKCAEAGVAFFFKQSSAPRTEMGIMLDGEIVRAYPAPLSINWDGSAQSPSGAPTLDPAVRAAYAARVAEDANDANATARFASIAQGTMDL